MRLDIIMARVTKISTSSQIFIFFGTGSSGGGVRSSQRRIENRDGIDSDVLLDQMRDLETPAALGRLRDRMLRLSS